MFPQEDQNLNLNGITCRHSRRTLQFQTLDEVCRAVLAYEEIYGKKPPSLSYTALKKNGELRPPKEDPFNNRHEASKHKSVFAETVAKDIADTFCSSHSYYGQSWGDDGFGVFRRCRLEVRRLRDGTFSLSLFSAKKGHEVESVLAECLHVPIGYDFCEIERTYRVEKNQGFSIPLEDIEAVYTAWDQPFNKRAFFSTFTTCRHCSIPHCLEGESQKKPLKSLMTSYTSPVLVVSDDTLSATIELTPSRSVTPHKNRTYLKRPEGHTFKIKNGMLMGPACLGWYGNAIAAGLTLTIQPKDGPTYNQALEERIRHMADAVHDFWMPAVQRLRPMPPPSPSL
ncbi:MAG: hypothetical protein PHS57_04060 [Alphaproteobacteria bacterium]|nr:hypothetical protein [Alphaproteobacteria bacterium]